MELPSKVPLEEGESDETKERYVAARKQHC